MALRRWKKVAPGHYERWSPWRMEVWFVAWLGEWQTWLQGETVYPAGYRTRKAAMLACERRAIELIQEERRRNAGARELFASLGMRRYEPPA